MPITQSRISSLISAASFAQDSFNELSTLIKLEAALRSNDLWFTNMLSLCQGRLALQMHHIQTVAAEAKHLTTSERGNERRREYMRRKRAMDRGEEVEQLPLLHKSPSASSHSPRPQRDSMLPPPKPSEDMEQRVEKAKRDLACETPTPAPHSPALQKAPALQEACAVQQEAQAKDQELLVKLTKKLF